jgi:tetratricopeptide (TPR) repeat protein
MVRFHFASLLSHLHLAAKALTRASAAAACVFGLLLATTYQASAFDKESAKENCRENVGKPFVRACMEKMGGKSEENRAKCRAIALPRFKACVVEAYMRGNSRANVPIALHKDGNPPEGATGAGNFLRAGFVAPPRTIADIAAILDSEKPDPATLEKLKADADASPSKNLSNADLAKFYYDRGTSRSVLGRNREALADGEKAAAQASGDGHFTQRVRHLIGLQKLALGDIKGALELGQFMIKDVDRSGQKGYLFSAYRWVAHLLIQMGDLKQAEGALQKSLSLIREARTSGHPRWRASYAAAGRSWEGDAEAIRAVIFDARGQFADAAASYAKARQWTLGFIPDLKNRKDGPPESQMRWVADTTLLDVARMKARQGRLAEAEADARGALLARLKDQGKYNPLTTTFVVGLSGILVEQGRYAEAEKLTKTALDIQRTLGIADDTQTSAQILSQLGAIQVVQRKLPEAVAVYADLDKAIAKWEPHRREVLELNGSRITALLASGEVQAGMAAAQAMFKQELARKGESHFDTASARGMVALGHLKAGNEAEAVREFKQAIPVLMAAARENAGDDDTTIVVGRRERLQSVVEAYIGLTAKVALTTNEAAVETFSLVDAIRGQSVQQALSASSARASVKDPALAELVRKEQDLSKQVNAQLGLFNNVLAGPSAGRDERVTKEISFSIEKLRSDRDKARLEINKRFPSYADLVDPKPPSIDQIKSTLAPGEAMLSFYFGREASFVWAVPKEGAVTFAAIPLNAGELETKVRALRAALEPQAAMVSDIPAFDLILGYELYSLLLKPVEAGWKQSKSLVVVTNGALGLLPLSLLPVTPAEAKLDDCPSSDNLRQMAG